MTRANALVRAINGVYDTLHNLSNEELRQKAYIIESKICDAEEVSSTLDKVLVDTYAIVKEIARRFSLGDIVIKASELDKKLAAVCDFIELKGTEAIYHNQWIAGGERFKWDMIHYDEQLLGGIFLHYGFAVEMATGEGKTLVATLPSFLNGLSHRGVHIMTVNPYLSKRDYEITRPIYSFFGLTTGCIETELLKEKAYQSDIIFGTSSEFVFDYLRDNIAIHPSQYSQKGHNFAIIDELDSNLIDDAETPHILSGGIKYDVSELYLKHKSLIEELVENNSLYTASHYDKKAEFTADGKEWIRWKIGDSTLFKYNKLYELDNTIDKPNLDKVAKQIELQIALNNLLGAYTIYSKDIDYIVDDSRVVIIDQNTGRLKPSNRWEHGLHTAIEIKENVPPRPESNSIAVISKKNYLRLYNKVSGMSGTVKAVAGELKYVYDLECVSIPTHKSIKREDFPLAVSQNSNEKYSAIVDKIKMLVSLGRPVLVSSTSISKSVKLCSLLDSNDIPYNKLDAKSECIEAALIAKAGVEGTVTVSTNIAGRGTDIKLTPNSIENGGLAVIGTELFDSSRIDNQLRGRAGRQGDPGSSIFYVSLDDDILLNLTPEERSELSKCSIAELQEYFRVAQLRKETSLTTKRAQMQLKDDTIHPFRIKYYNQRKAIIINDEKIVDSIIANIFESTDSYTQVTINNNMSRLVSTLRDFSKKQIQYRHKRIEEINLPCVCGTALYVLAFKIQEHIENSDTSLIKEIMRQIILLLYDENWGHFVRHINEDLDKEEVSKLPEEFHSMEKAVLKQAIDFFQYTQIPIGNHGGIESVGILNPRNNNHTNPACMPISVGIHDLCPCGSGLEFIDCHGKLKRRPRR